ncbi:polysaccharide biosynthesis protein [Listeria monocytogenes]|uniref:putative polysaccharide biosynthesis protein n=1 Tax=Listeria monocytogenes TaxID=1639 RepID=UPI000775E444|nr:polysaccharide biosynthesis protein [Listeria monocytogenes]EAC9136447.1 polysaccharide biosynthesis protein [Listeria monocytogenes]KXS74168.1 cell division protein [Listeria monocytogenes]KXX06075.1 cell division protein [Listeria monocytogenes]
MSSKLMRGTAVLTAGTLLSKILGILYVIPFYWIAGGEQATILYQYGYVPYQIFLNIATAGVPLAVAKYISKYNSLNEYALSQRLYRSSTYLMIFTGIASFLIMYIFAPILAGMQEVSGGTSIEDISTVIRAVSFALLIIPVMSLLRGYFQGFHSMGPSAVSQVIEQIARIVFLLASTYIVLHLIGGSLVTAMSLATFAAFVGAFFSLICLIWYYRKRKPGIQKMIDGSDNKLRVSTFHLLKEISISAVPFIIVGMAMSLYQQIDLFTFARILTYDGMDGKTAEDLLSIFNFSVQKIIMIPGTLALAFSMTLVPLVAASFHKGRIREVHHHLTAVFQVLLFLVVPACLGIALLADPLYTIFYGYNTDGSMLLQFFAPFAIFFSLFSVTAAILQGIDEQRYTVLSLLLGLLTKSVLQMPLILLFGAKGGALATGLGYIVSVVFTIFIIKKYAKYSFKYLFRRLILILGISAVMLLSVWLIYHGLILFLNPHARLSALVIVFVSAGFGAYIYAFLAAKAGLLNYILGDRMYKIRKKLHLI